MGCNCRVTESIIAIVVLVFTFWQVSWSQWIIALAALALLVHSFWCKNCCNMEEEMPAKKRRR